MTTTGCSSEPFATDIIKDVTKCQIFTKLEHGPKKWRKLGSWKSEIYTLHKGVNGFIIEIFVFVESFGWSQMRKKLRVC